MNDSPRDPDFDELQFVKDQCTTLSTELERIRRLERQHTDTIKQLQTNVKNAEARCDFKHEQMKALAEEIAEQEKQIAQMMAILLCQATTIRRLTEERLGPEKKNPERPAALYHLDEAYND